MSTYNEILTICSSNKTSVIWLMEKGILNETFSCIVCVHAMFKSFGKNRFICSKCRKEVSFRKDSIVENSRIPFGKLVHLMYLWSAGIQNSKFIHMVGVSMKVVCKIYFKFREICTNDLKGKRFVFWFLYILKYFSLERPIRIGGIGQEVEIDESCFATKSKYNRGRRHDQCWVFGGVERTTKRWFAKIVNDNRTREVLLPIIKQYIKPGKYVYFYTTCTILISFK